MTLLPLAGGAVLAWSSIGELLGATSWDKRTKEQAATIELLHRLPLFSSAVVAHTPYGKPFLPDFPSWEISISHSSEMVAILCAPSPYRVGLDVEPLTERIPRLLPRIATPEEQTLWERFRNEQGPHSAHLFAHILWCCKEAAYKMQGTQGQPLPFTAFSVRLSLGTNPATPLPSLSVPLPLEVSLNNSYFSTMQCSTTLCPRHIVVYGMAAPSR